MSAIDTASNTVVDTITLGMPADISGMVITPDGTRIYMSAGNTSNSVFVIDTTGNDVVGVVPVGPDVGASPGALAVSPDGTRVYVANFFRQSVSVIDTSILAEVATVQVGLGPTALRVTSDGARIYVANMLGNSVSVIDTTSNTAVATVAVGRGPRNAVLVRTVD
jgi:YVTN family beta-propeller protein